MKVAVISVSNIYCMPYYYKYEKIICDAIGGFDLLFWNRDLISEPMDHRVTAYSYDIKCAYNDLNKWKIFKFYSFFKFVKKKLRTGKYDRIVILGTYSLLTFFLQPYLTSAFANRYWLDIRDYTYEHLPWFYRREEKLIHSAYKTVISSDGYKVFLPEAQYEMAHNADDSAIEQYLNSVPSEPDPAQKHPIRISFIGNVRYLEQNTKLLQAFANDNRFLLKYFGSNSDKIAQIAKENSIANVLCEGRFPHEKTAGYYQKTDIINNLYGNDSVELTTAISNKFYFACAFEKPILVCPGTHMEKISTENGLGFAIDWDTSDIPDRLYHWYLEEFPFSKQKNTYMNRVRADEKIFLQALREFVSE